MECQSSTDVHTRIPLKWFCGLQLWTFEHLTGLWKRQRKREWSSKRERQREREREREGERINSKYALPNNQTQENTHLKTRCFAIGALYVLNCHHRSNDGVHWLVGDIPGVRKQQKWSEASMYLHLISSLRYHVALLLFISFHFPSVYDRKQSF